MSVVRGEALCLAFGAKTLWDHAELTLSDGERVGLVGANGTGKSSLLKVLAGVMEPDAGRVVVRKEARVGYLPQELAEVGRGAVVDCVMRSVPGRDALERSIVALEQAVGASEIEPEEQLELAGRLAERHEALAEFEARYGRHRAESILTGLGFRPERLAGDVTELSGGWRMRVALAGLLLQAPDLLLLDEPTNHLDLPSLIWFEEFLERYHGAVLLISHDRELLNRQVRRILALNVEGLRSYSGNYDRYVAQRRIEREQLEARAAQQAARRAELQAFIDRFGAKATKARQAQSRAKQLEKEEVIVVEVERPKVHFRFPEAPRSGQEVLAISGVDKAFGSTPVYRGLEVRLQRGQRVAVTGLNGAGKSTLLKLIAGDLSPDRGTLELGHNVVMGYYAQHHAELLGAERTVLDELRQAAPARTDGELRHTLGAFLFSGADVDKPVGVLSGGERARVALAKLLVRPANFLLLDEPTNHLDLDSSDALADALERFEGTLLFVSHNQTFLNRLASHVWEVSLQTINVFPGNLEDYLAKARRDARERLRQGESAEGSPSPASARTGREAEKQRKREEAEARQRRAAVEGPLKRELERLEREIAKLEAEQAERSTALADGSLYDDFKKAQPLMDAHRDAEEKLRLLYLDWEAAQERLDRVAESPG